MRALKLLTTISISGLLFLGACGDDDGPTPTPDAATPDAEPEPDIDAGDDIDAGLTPEEQLFADIADYDGTDGWAAFPTHEGIVEFADHGATHRQVFANDTALDDLATLADGSILVKENRTGAEGVDLAAITVMKKDGGVWTYGAYMPDGTNMVYGTADDLSADGGCAAAACHGDTDGTGDDEVFLNNDAVAAKALFDTLNDETDKYDTWISFDDYGGDTPEYQGPNDTNPTGHGVDWQRVFINETAEGDTAALPNDSILVKEERSGDTDGDGTGSTLDALTIMQRVDADNDVWMWIKVSADGKVKLAGENGAAACANDACHGKGDSGADRVFGNGMAD